MRDGALQDLLAEIERTKAKIRARVEHPFHVVKNLLRYRKVRYKGLAKSTAQLFSLRVGEPGDREEPAVPGPQGKSVMCTGNAISGTRRRAKPASVATEVFRHSEIYELTRL